MNNKKPMLSHIICLGLKSEPKEARFETLAAVSIIFLKLIFKCQKCSKNLKLIPKHNQLSENSNNNPLSKHLQPLKKVVLKCHLLSGVTCKRRVHFQHGNHDTKMLFCSLIKGIT